MRPWRVVGDAKQKIKATLELAVSTVIDSANGTPQRVVWRWCSPVNEFERLLHEARLSISPLFNNLRNEVKPSRDRVRFSFFFCVFVGCTDGASCARPAKRVVAFLAKIFYAYLLSDLRASRQVSGVRWARSPFVPVYTCGWYEAPVTPLQSRGSSTAGEC